MNLKKRKSTINEELADKKTKQSSMTSFFAFKRDSSTLITNSFNKRAWVEELTENQRELLKLEIEFLHESWLCVLKDELIKPYFLKLKNFLKQEKQSYTIFPSDQDIYSWSHYTPLNTVKVVILGQDPYHNYNQAHGLCFSVRPPTPPPPSLKNIFIALQKDYPSFNIPKNGLLTPWAKRGVLLLNSSLTVRAHQAGSHSQKGWEEFTSKIIQIVEKRRTGGVVFLAWGSPAAKRVENVNKNIHLILKSVHPSPLSASKGFFDCGHFKKTNEWLLQKYGPDGIIDWNCLNTENSVDFCKISGSISEKHTESEKLSSKIPSHIENKKTNQEEITTVNLPQDELVAIESSITLDELNDGLSSDDSKFND